MIADVNTFVLPDILSEDRDLYYKVIHAIYGYRKLLLSYSGGLDSTVLLEILTMLIKYTKDQLILSNLFISVRAVYVHHGLSSQADSWAVHCAQQCKIRNVSFRVVYINCCNKVGKKQNIEALARSLRYQKLFQCLDPEEVLITAHHMDDQAETVLLALKRGSGPAGLSGIYKNVLYNDQYRLLRPLLECSRAQLKAYACKRKLIWIEDHTNLDIHFDRNFLRIQILPLLKNRWPYFNKVVARTAQLCRNQEILLDELLEESLKKIIDADGALLLCQLFKCSVFKRHAILRRWLSSFIINMPSYQLINRIWTDVVLSKIDAAPVLHVTKKYICRRFRNKLYILPIDMKSALNMFSLSWSIFYEDVMLLPHKLGLLKFRLYNMNECFLQDHVYVDVLLNMFFDYFKHPGQLLTSCIVRSPTIYEKVSIRFGYIDGLIYLTHRKHGRKLKKIWQELNIPPWLRSRIPLLFYNEILIAAIGVFITQQGKAPKNVTMTMNTDKNCVLCRVFWIQDVSYSKFFRNVMHNFLK